VRGRREILGISQRALAERSGVKQPLIAAIERGRRVASTSARAALEGALTIYPAEALEARRDQVFELFSAAGLAPPEVFGSVARGEAGHDSDIDFLVPFTDRHDILDLLELEDALEELLTIPVSVVDERAIGPVIERAKAEAVPL
ncbi:MAG: nucleotidyltransferase domain-containing protein, partial [Ruaniaceae bacterium]|nr:nucleotidyltransferase domain-containing protein [Ruaniaceae bacterium]